MSGINLESASALSRWKREQGANQGRPNVETVPDYILRCRYKRAVLAQQEAILERLRDEAPGTYRKATRYGFDTLVMNLGANPFSRFCAVAEAAGIVDAYLVTVTYPKPSQHHGHSSAVVPGPGL